VFTLFVVLRGVSLMCLYGVRNGTQEVSQGCTGGITIVHLRAVLGGCGPNDTSGFLIGRYLGLLRGGHLSKSSIIRDTGCRDVSEGRHWTDAVGLDPVTGADGGVHSRTDVVGMSRFRPVASVRDRQSALAMLLADTKAHGGALPLSLCPDERSATVGFHFGTVGVLVGRIGLHEELSFLRCVFHVGLFDKDFIVVLGCLGLT